jgi:hypothetical protein
LKTTHNRKTREGSQEKKKPMKVMLFRKTGKTSLQDVHIWQIFFFLGFYSRELREYLNIRQGIQRENKVGYVVMRSINCEVKHYSEH